MQQWFIFFNSQNAFVLNSPQTDTENKSGPVRDITQKKYQDSSPCEGFVDYLLFFWPLWTLSLPEGASVSLT